MTPDQLLEKANKLAEDVSDEHLRVSVKYVDRDMASFDVWYGFLNMQYGIDLPYFMNQPRWETYFKEELLRSMLVTEQSLNDTSRLLNQFLTNRQPDTLRIVTVVDDDLQSHIHIWIEAGVINKSPVEPHEFRYKGQKPSTYHTVWAAWHEKTNTLFVTPIKEHSANGGFGEFIKYLTDMELVVLQSESRKINDTQSVNDILAELGRREKNRTSFVKSAAAKAEGDNHVA